MSGKIGPAIGIDLGTWKCCVGVVRDGKVEIIENERGSKTTPSYVAFTETERIIGEDAKSQVALNPTNTVYGVKRIIGRRFDDRILQDIKDTFPFAVKQVDGKSLIEVSYKGNMISLYPEQVSAILLTKMKRIAESHLGCEVRDAVISVPAYFNNAQRQATKDAGAIAGLHVLGLINEPTAAALAYRDNKAPTNETICVVDLGGGTLDVSVIQLEDDKGITVLKTLGNTSFGGMDLDQRLVTHFQKEFLQTSNHDIDGNKKASQRLRLACEKLKHTLSLLPTGRIQLDCLAKDTDLESSISRDTFDELCHEELEQSLYSVIKTLRSSELSCEQQPEVKFNRIVLVGGSTRIPYVQELLKNVLGKGLDKSVNPDEAVAHGAAIKAALLGKEPSLPDVAVQDVNTHTFVMESEHGRHFVFRQNSSRKVRRFAITTEKDFNTQFNLFEILFDLETKGEVFRRLIGSVKLSDLANPLLSELIFSVDISGVFGGEIVLGEERLMFISKDYCLNSGKQLAVMSKREEEFRADEENERRRLVSLSDLEAYCFRNKPLIEELIATSGSEELKHKFIELCDDTIDWLDCTPEAAEDECEQKLGKLVEMYDWLIPPPPPPPDDVDATHSGRVAPCPGPTIEPNTAVTDVGRMTSGAGRETQTNRGVGDHPLKDTTTARPEGERVHSPPVERSGFQGDEQTEGPFAPWEPDLTYPGNVIPNSDGVNKNRDAARDGFNDSARAGTSTANMRPTANFGTGRHTAARAEKRGAVPVHSGAKGLQNGGNDPFPNVNTRYNRSLGHAVRNDKVGAAPDTLIQMSRGGSDSSFESQTYLNDVSEDRTPGKLSSFKGAWKRFRGCITGAAKDETNSQSKEKDKKKNTWC